MPLTIQVLVGAKRNSCNNTSRQQGDLNRFGLMDSLKFVVNFFLTEVYVSHSSDIAHSPLNQNDTGSTGTLGTYIMQVNIPATVLHCQWCCLSDQTQVKPPPLLTQQQHFKSKLGSFVHSLYLYSINGVCGSFLYIGYHIFIHNNSGFTTRYTAPNWDKDSIQSAF